jgi:hypothetical protein
MPSYLRPSTTNHYALASPRGDYQPRDSVDSNVHRDLPRTFFGSSEDILDWGIFQARHDGQQIEELIFDPTSESHNDHLSPTIHFTTARVSLEGTHVDPRTSSSAARELREEVS